MQFFQCDEHLKELQLERQGVRFDTESLILTKAHKLLLGFKSAVN